MPDSDLIHAKEPTEFGFGLIPTPIEVHPFGVMAAANDDGPDADNHLDEFVTRGWNQNPTNTCVWWAIRGAWHVLAGVYSLPLVDLSVLGGYYATRMRTHQGNRNNIVDFGCRPPDAAQSLNELGFIPNELWPFAAANVDEEPDWKALVSVKKAWFFLRRILAPYGQRGKAIRHVIANLGLPVLIGQEVDQSYIDWRPGDPAWSMPSVVPKGRHMEFIATYDTAGPSTVSSWGDMFDRKLSWNHVESDHVHELWYPVINPKLIEPVLLARSP